MILKKSYQVAVLLATLLVFGLVPKASAQKLALKTNALYLATTSPNLALEVRTSPHTTIEFGGGMSLWDFSDRTSFRHWMLQPELRYWLCESMNGSFFGLHAHGGQFNIGSIDIPVGRLKELKDNRYQGYFYGAGISYGYQWILSNRLNLEASIGGGYARIKYEQYPCTSCGNMLKEGYYNYWGVTRATLSLLFFFN